MIGNDKFQEQFNLQRRHYLENLDFLNWYRFFFIFKEIIHLKPKNILEVGEGSGIVRRTLEPLIERYETMDVNKKLEPTYLNDVCNFLYQLKERFDCVVAADILEHIPFGNLEKALNNLYEYLRIGGSALITIPHRSHYFLSMTSLKHKPSVIRIPTLKRLTGRRAWIDPDHRWEIGDGRHKIRDVERVMKKIGFKIEKREKLLYVDFWVLKK